MTNSKNNNADSWVVKNIFSIISLLITVGGFVAGYTKLQVTVQELQKQAVDKEVVRTVTKECMNDKIAPIQESLKNIQYRIDKAEQNIQVLNYKTNNPTVLYKR